jgi:hypothetical protein
MKAKLILSFQKVSGSNINFVSPDGEAAIIYAYVRLAPEISRLESKPSQCHRL